MLLLGVEDYSSLIEYIEKEANKGIRVVKLCKDNQINLIELDYDINSVFHIFYSVEELVSNNNSKHLFSSHCDKYTEDYESQYQEDVNEYIVLNFNVNLISILKLFGIDYDVKLSNIIFLQEVDIVDDDFEYDQEVDYYDFNNLGLSNMVFKKGFNINCIQGELELIGIQADEMIKMFDVYDKLKIYHSKIDSIVMENYLHKETIVFGSEIGDLKILPEQEDQIMNTLTINYSTVENLLINDQKLNISLDIKNVIITNSEISYIEIENSGIKEMKLKKSKIEELILSNVIFEQDFYCSELSINDLNLVNTYYLGRVFLDQNFQQSDNIIRIIKDSNNDYNLLTVESVLRMIENTNNTPLKLRLLNLYYEQKNKKRKFGLVKAFNGFLDLTTGYFTNYKKVLASSFVIMILFSIFYCIFDSNLVFLANSNPSFYDLTIQSIYLSISSFLSFNIGDVNPIGFLKLFVALESLLGYLLAASFIATLTRNFT